MGPAAAAAFHRLRHRDTDGEANLTALTGMLVTVVCMLSWPRLGIIFRGFFFFLKIAIVRQSL